MFDCLHQRLNQAPTVQDAPPSQARGKRRNRAFPSGQAGAMQAGARELHERREEWCKDNSCAQATKQLPCSAMLHAPRQPNGEQLHGNSLAKKGLARMVRCRLGHAGNQTAPKLLLDLVPMITDGAV
ncbi:hypothetical protein C2845_PM01G00580 [Panicum miliaceum]|uniref:Uncharacterized protein n=1 Tax=Panicum miliaceum TaxID=4540 RepID=A0A3L6TIM6_PANMI|nr:hypothetical protein C2845_PM01G00580 [Panicum miliaceum]